MGEKKAKSVACRGCGKPHSGRGKLGRRTLYCSRCKPESLRNRWREAQARHEAAQKKVKAAAKKARAERYAREKAKSK